MGTYRIKSLHQAYRLGARALWAAFVLVSFGATVAECGLNAPVSSPCGCAAEHLGLGENVTDCCCSYEAVDYLNDQYVFPVLEELRHLPFFKYFRVRLYCDCPFWVDDGMCILEDCSVCECPENEVPEPLRTDNTEKAANISSPKLDACTDSRVDNNLSADFHHQWKEVDNPWTYENESLAEDFIYVDLLRNPERYTGYKGESAARIWNAIYNENCFAEFENDNQCVEKRMFFRLISGLHASISAHIANQYWIQPEEIQGGESMGRVAAGYWGKNLTLFKDRLGTHPERIENLYFVYLFTLRAVLKAKEFLSGVDFETGNSREDLRTSQLIQTLVNSREIDEACPIPFDEGRLWKGEGGSILFEELQSRFRNISAIMDCVGCDKCKVWGKLQVSGLATAIKILFTNVEEEKIELQRNEVIALINGLRQLSFSVRITRDYISELVEIGDLKPTRPLSAQLSLKDAKDGSEKHLPEVEVDQTSTKRESISNIFINKRKEL